jgi:hypothetical protein
MNRWLLFWVCAILGLTMLICGLLVPMHLRAVDASLVERAGRSTPGLIEEGLSLVKQRKLGAAQLLFQAAQGKGFPDTDKLGAATDNLAMQEPDLLAWGSDVSGKIAALRRPDAPARRPNLESIAFQPFVGFIVRSENRETLLANLGASASPAVQGLLQIRALTNTVIFAPSRSASGQALDVAILIGGLLLEEGRLSTGLSNAVVALTLQANRDGNSQPLEQVLMDVMSLGQRLNWGQLVDFVHQIDDVETLRLLGGFVRSGYSMPTLFSALKLSGKPDEVATYLVNFSQTGLNDLGESLRFGAGGVNELLERNQRLHFSALRHVKGHAPFNTVFAITSDYCLRQPRLSLMIKWLLYLGGGFLLAAALHYARRVPTLERPLQVRGFHVAREILFALGFLLVVLLLSEPFLAQESQKMEFPFRLRLPTVGSVVPAGNAGAHSSLMNQLSLLTLLLFFVLQALIYVACLVKLAEIQRQRVPPPLKLKLLENEDHLFDAGLYLGFVGTIISLILVSLGVIKPSLMAAYSSTSFGIIFVSVFKIFHLRPLRRKLLLEAEAGASVRVTPTAEPARS